MTLPLIVRLRHWLITSRWQRWLFPVACCVPYLLCLIWLLTKGLLWIAQVMLAPLLMAAILAGITLWLARLEFRIDRRVQRRLPK